MGFISQQFADMAFVIFGTTWKSALVNVLEVEEAQIDAWEADPATLPDDIEEQLRLIGEERIGEIQAFLYLMKETGMSRVKSGDAAVLLDEKTDPTVPTFCLRTCGASLI